MRERKDYRLPPRPTPLSEAGVPSGLVARFLDPTGAPARSVDLSAYAGRARLAADLVHALRHHLADKSDAYRQTTRDNLAPWFRFLDEHDPGRVAVLSALDVGGATLRAYVAWIGRQPVGKRTRVSWWTALKVLLAWLLRHRPDLVQPGLELPFNPFPRTYAEGRLRPALARAELDAVLAACRTDIEANWADFQRGRALIAAAGPAAALARPEDLDVRDFGTLLALIAGRFGGVCPAWPRPGSGAAVSGHVAAALPRHGGVRRVARHLHATMDTLVPYVIAIAAQTFANPEALRGLRRDCMTEHVVLDRRVLVTWDKGRAGRPQRRSFLRDRGLSVPNLIDRVLAMTAPLVPLAPARERDKLFLVAALTTSRRVGLLGKGQLNRHVRDFVRRHGLRGAGGAPLALSLASLRATGLGLAHAALGHDVLKTQTLANHANADTTRRYVDRPALRAERAAGVARLQGRFVEAVRGTGPEGGDAGDAAGVDARHATASGFVCADPLSGIAPGQRKGRLCTAWLGCFTCPNAVIPLDAGTMARLLRTRAALADARAGMSQDRWRLLYAPKLEVIERDILPRFPAGVHAAAEAMLGQVPPLPPVE